jgi:type IV pilus biogenesis protein CpaD/CtpE
VTRRRTAVRTAVRTPVRTAVPAAVLAALLSGCLSQPQEANDNGPQPDPTQPGDVVRTPVPVETAPSTVPLPGASNEPNVSGDVSATPGAE